MKFGDSNGWVPGFAELSIKRVGFSDPLYVTHRSTYPRLTLHRRALPFVPWDFRYTVYSWSGSKPLSSNVDDAAQSMLSEIYGRKLLLSSFR